MTGRSKSPRAFTNILCPIDFSDPSRAALRVAADLAQRSKGRITVLYVHDPTIAGVEAVAFPDASVDELRSEMRTFATSVLTGKRSSSQAIRYVASIGNPAREIVKTAKGRHCDLIVMGSRGLGGVRKLLLGSTTDRVIRHAATPVLAVPARTPVRRRRRKKATRSIRLAG